MDIAVCLYAYLLVDIWAIYSFLALNKAAVSIVGQKFSPARSESRSVGVEDQEESQAPNGHSVDP